MKRCIFVSLKYPKKFPSFVLQDREEPSSVDKHLSDVPFEAKFAEEETNATEFSEDPGSDGFVMNSAPLFEVVTSNHRIQ